jgi:hypothetical protein
MAMMTKTRVAIRGFKKGRTVLTPIVAASVNGSEL